MSKKMLVSGTVIEKSYLPPPGAMDRYWCYLLVEAESGDRVSVRLHQDIHDKIVNGDKIRFVKPRRKHKRVKDVQIL